MKSTNNKDSASKKQMVKLPTLENDRVLNLFKTQVNAQGRDLYQKKDLREIIESDDENNNSEYN